MQRVFYLRRLALERVWLQVRGMMHPPISSRFARVEKCKYRPGADLVTNVLEGLLLRLTPVPVVVLQQELGLVMSDR